MNIHVSVTSADILAGDRDNCESCPVALALERAAPGYEVVQVFDQNATLRKTHNGAALTAKLPVDVIAYIYDFDNGELQSPIEFDLTFE